MYTIEVKLEVLRAAQGVQVVMMTKDSDSDDDGDGDGDDDVTAGEGRGEDVGVLEGWRPWKLEAGSWKQEDKAGEAYCHPYCNRRDS